MRRILLLVASCLLLASSLWASRIFLDELEVLPGEWALMGESLFSSRDETVVTALSGDGGTLVRAVTRQGASDSGLSESRGSLSIYRRDGMGWVQVGEPIEGTPQQPITYLLDVSHDGSRIAYRSSNRFLNDVIRDGKPVNEWNAGWIGTDPLASGGICTDGDEACPGLTWQAVDSDEEGEAVFQLSIIGDDSYRLHLETASPPDLSLSRNWVIQTRMVTPPTGADVGGSTLVSMGIGCPAGCEQTLTNMSLSHDGNWQSGGVSLSAMTDAEALSINKPLILDLPEGLAGAVIEISSASFNGAGSLIKVSEIAETARNVWAYANRVYTPVAAKLTSDGRKILVSGYNSGWNVNAYGCDPLSGIQEVFELHAESATRRGEHVCGEYVGLEVFAAIDNAAETLAVGRLEIGLAHDSAKVFSFINGSWEEVFAVGFDSVGEILPSLSDDGSVLVVGDADFSYRGSSAEYSYGTGTYLDAVAGAGRIRRYEKSDDGWREVGLPLIGNTNDHLTVGYPQGLSADGSRIVTRTLAFPETDLSSRGLIRGVSIVDQREIVVFGERIMLPDDMPAITLPSASQRQLTEMDSPQDTPKQSIKVLQWQGDGWHQAGEDIEVEHVAGYVNVTTSISADGQLTAVSQSASCTAPSLTGCQNPPPDIYLPSSSTYSFTTLTDKIALEGIYEALNGSNWINDTGWLRDESHCTWFGVLCSSDGFVSALWLDENNLSGLLPDAIGHLRYLRSIDLSNNTLSGGFPATLPQLRDLSRLFASAAGLSGVVESSFGDMEQLTYLDLSGNELLGDVSTFSGLKNLRFLDLSDNAFSGNFPTNSPWPLAERVNLSGNALSGALPASINALSSLRYLNLGRNALSGGLPASLEYLATLEKINLSENAFTGPISESLGAFLATREPILTANKFNCPYPSALVDYFSEVGEECVPPDPPGKPVILRTDYGNGEIVLVVAVASDGGATINTYDAFCSGGEQVFTGSSTTTRIVVSGLTNGVTYTCHATASNSAGSSEVSSDTDEIIPEELPGGLPIWLLYQATRQ